MENSPWQLAKRELHAVLTNRSIWVGATATGLVLGFAAPFGTHDDISLLPRLIYWTVVVQVTLMTGTLIASLLNPGADRLPHYRWLCIAGVGGVIGICVSLEVLALNWLSFGLSPFRPAYTVSLTVNALAISIIVNLAASWLSPSVGTADTGSEGSTPKDSTEEGPALLARLPFDKRGTLLSMTVQDHYVEVTTTSGTEMLLMRFSDAMKEAGAGLQVHRSHWVAENAVVKAERSGSAARLTTADGRDLPVSRRYLPDLRKRGLLS